MAGAKKMVQEENFEFEIDEEKNEFVIKSVFFLKSEFFDWKAKGYGLAEKKY